MANKNVDNFRVSYVGKEGKVSSRTFATAEAAQAAYEQICICPTVTQRKLEVVSACVPVLLAGKNWKEDAHKKLNEHLWREDAKKRLKQAGINSLRIEAIMKLAEEDIRNAVVSRTLSTLTDIPGIGEKTAKVAIFALRPICRASEVKASAMREFIRVRLNNDTHDFYTKTDTIRKGVGDVEAKAIELGGPDAIIHVEALINEPVDPSDVDEANWAKALETFLYDAVYGGLIVNGRRYVPVGHTPNGAKLAHVFWVLDIIHEELDEWAKINVSSDWRVTTAKEIAYLWGLKAAPCKSLGIPFKPEDFAIMPSVIDTVKANATKLFMDGHQEDIDKYPVEVNRTDGLLMFHVTSEMKAILFNRMLARGDDPETAERILNKFCNELSPFSVRSDKIALKGLALRNFDFHSALKAEEVVGSKPITKLPDGRDLKYIVGMLDETTVKTPIGEKGAYKTFTDFCNAVGDFVDIKVCVKAHKKSKKDVSYQVIQAMTEAPDENISNLVVKTTNRIADIHTIKGATRILGREMGGILEKYPEFANVPYVKEKISKKIKQHVDAAYSGKLLHCSEYMFGAPDPVYALQGWFGLERTGMFNQREFHTPCKEYGPRALWRSPVLHPTSVAVMNNVTIPCRFKRFFMADEYMMLMNCKGLFAVVTDADWDGDHFSESDDEDIVECAKATLTKWRRVIVWETPKPEKGDITREKELAYFANLHRRNELGLTVNGLNKLFTQVLNVKDKKTGVITKKIIPLSREAVNFKKFAANVLVDASKHGGADIEEPSESASAKYMDAPWAKNYRDALLAPLRKDKNGNVAPDAEAEKQANLDKLANLTLYDESFAVSTLNKYFLGIAKIADRSTDVHDAPNDEFDCRVLMFNPNDTTRRGMIGLTRRGNMAAIKVEGQWMKPDQGLFESLARRIYHDFKAWDADNSRKDKEDMSLQDQWRANALAEIQRFAEMFGRTLEDAYDVITYNLFTTVDKQYQNLTNNEKFVRDDLWKAYFVIFGGMARAAAERDTDRSAFATQPVSADNELSIIDDSYDMPTDQEWYNDDYESDYSDAYNYDDVDLPID